MSINVDVNTFVDAQSEPPRTSSLSNAGRQKIIRVCKMASGTDPDAMEIDAINTGKQSKDSKNKSGSTPNNRKGKGKKGKKNRNKNNNNNNNTSSSSDKDFNKWSGAICNNCRGVGHVASVCPSVAPNFDVLSQKNSEHQH